MKHSLPTLPANRSRSSTTVYQPIRNIKVLALLLVCLLWAQHATAQFGANGSHDPGTLVKEGNKYWMFTTGDGIYGAYSTDLINWTPGPRTVFPSNPNSWPTWINTIIPGFAGNFWAPECIYLNGKYYMYYSCSTFGSSTSAIGVATSLSLDPASPNYGWTDQGMVIASNSSTGVNAIDPAILQDTNGQLYMYYGSFSGGLGVLELDPQTGLKKAGATTTFVAGNTTSGTRDWEAAYVVKENGFYYFYANRGLCCQGLNSTYRIVVGRSTSPTGPFVDKNGVSLRATNAQATAAGSSGVGSLVLGSSGRYIGPGHFGLLRDNGVNYVSMHYYDGTANGAPKLDIATLKYDANNWPIISRDWLPAGRYKITNQNSGLVWDAWGCTASLGSPIAQAPWLGALCQQWDFIPVGDGYYKLANALNPNRVADLTNCVNANGTAIDIWDWLNNDCQKMQVQRAANGSFIFSPAAANTRLLEVPAASTIPGVQLGLWDYTGHDCQKWAIEVAPATWTGAASTAWSNAGNWSLGMVPTASDNVIIPAGLIRYPLVAAGTAAANDLTISSGGALAMTGGQLTLTGNLTNNGTLTATSGLLAFAGPAGQTLGGTQPSALADLRVGTAGLSLGSPAAVAGVLTLTGNLTTNAQTFTLRSGATGTALVVNDGGIVQGTATVQRYIDPMQNAGAGYRHYSAPVSNSTVADLATSGFTPVVNPTYNTSATPTAVIPFPTVFGYDENRVNLSNTSSGFDKGYVSPTALTDALLIGRGYAVNLAAREVVDFVGTLHNGPITLGLTSTRDANPNGGWHLLGNPYPAPLDYSLVDPSDRAGLEAAIYVYSSTSPYAGQYRSYVNGIGNAVLPVGQGFFARVSSGRPSASLTFRNSQRRTAPDGTIFQRQADTRPLVQLTLQGAGSPLSDEATVYFDAGATSGFEPNYDAEKLLNPMGLNLSTSVGGQQLAIDGQPELGSVQRVVPLALGVPMAGSYTFTATQLRSLNTVPVYLRDLLTGAVVNLAQQPTYQFTVANAAVLTRGRFDLVFSPQHVLATVPAALAQQVGVYPNPATSAVTLELPPNLSRQAVTLNLVDAVGQVVRQQVLPASLGTHQLPLTGVATGVYSLRLTTELGTVVRKLVVEQR
jgi:arabinan endo-1,5-alpha-L-arabinosidase